MFEQLIRHLLPAGSHLEQAAFLLATVARTPDGVDFYAVDAVLLQPEDFDEQDADYLEVGDAAKARIIKRAHDARAALIEVHSHPGPFSALFSASDIAGLRETVPHMWWRLKSRPYAAVVVAANDFDALVWVDDPRSAQPLDGLMVGDRVLRPTGLTLRPETAHGTPPSI